MAQQRRMVYGKMFANHKLNCRSPVVRYLYVGTIVLADDDGRLSADARYLKGQILPYDDVNHIEIEGYIKDLHDDGLIIVYETEGAKYIQHPNWLEYQSIRGDMYQKSTIPPPVTVTLRTRNEPVTEPLHKISKDNINKDKLSKYKGVILNHWNSKKIITHRVLAQKAETEIENALKKFTVEEIMKAMDVYAAVLEPDVPIIENKKYYWTYKWNIYEFLKRGLNQFDGKKPEDYLKFDKKVEIKKTTFTSI